MSFDSSVNQLLLRLRIVSPAGDATPSPWRVVLASVISIAGSLGADWLLVRFATHVSSSLHGYSHFRLVDYGTLSFVGVSAAGVGWFITTRVTLYHVGCFFVFPYSYR